MSTSRSYRPIALLSVLGEGLERLVAKCMAFVAIKCKILAHQKFDALPFRSSVDLTSFIIHDIEFSLARDNTATVSNLDVKGAFDAILPE